MTAMLLAIGLFMFWAILGRAVLAVLPCGRNPLQAALLSPSVGLAATLLPVFVLNRLGLPVGSFAPVLTAVLLLAALATLAALRPPIDGRGLVPFAGLLFLALWLVGRPMLDFGFDWLSFANDDMANYVLAAHRLVNHGFFSVPDTASMISGKDYTLFYWSFNLATRPGSELITAWVIGLTHLTGHQVFMPVMVALHLMLIAVGGALATRADGATSPLGAGLTILFLAASALVSLGTLYQLISQNGGLSLLGAAGLIALRSDRPEGRLATIRFAGLLALVASALFIMYPEAFPFLLVSFTFYLLLSLFRGNAPGRAFWIAAAAAVPIAAVVMGSYALTGLAFLAHQTGAGTEGGKDLDISLFPYYLLPSGLADFWGLQPVSPLSTEPVLSITITIGAVLLLIALPIVAKQALQLQPAACIAGVMFALGFVLFAVRSDFGLFKLAMFIQPFLAASIAMWLTNRPMRRLLQTAPIVALALANLPAQSYYVARSTGAFQDIGSTFAEIPNASTSAILKEFTNLLSQSQAPNVILDTANIVLAKAQALYLAGRQNSFPTGNIFINIIGPSRYTDVFAMLDPRLHIAELNTRATLQARWVRGEFDLKDGQKKNGFELDQQPIGANADVIVNTGNQSLFNRRRFGSDSTNFSLIPLNAITNHLIFVRSDLGPPYFTSERRKVAYHQLERDLLFDHQTMSGVGRHLLFQVLNPTDRVRVMLSMTATLKADGENILPPASAIGDERVDFPLAGRGAARVVSPPISPQVIQGRSYVGIDMNVDGTKFPFNRTGLMNLYGADIYPDYRRLVGFARDISLVSEEEYAGFVPPSLLQAFPADLQHPDLEFSGFYEDGWIGDRAWVRLSEPPDTDRLTVKGAVPRIGDGGLSPEVIILVDGEEVARRQLELGDFEISVPRQAGTGKRLIELRFSAVQRLPGGDNRPVAARITLIGFRQASPPVAIERFPSDLSAPDLDVAGIYQDGWVANQASVTLRQPDPESGLRIRGGFPRIDSTVQEADLVVLVDGEEALHRRLEPGDFSLDLPARLTPGNHRVELRFSRLQTLPGGDGRKVSARLTYVGFQRPSPPPNIDDVPSQVRNPDIQAVGIYADGWVAGSASLVLAQSDSAPRFTVAGIVPDVQASDFSSELTVTIDGHDVARQRLGVGEFQLEAPAPPGAGSRRIELRFSDLQQLPSGDGRWVAARLKSLGFKSPT